MYELVPEETAAQLLLQQEDWTDTPDPLFMGMEPKMHNGWRWIFVITQKAHGPALSVEGAAFRQLTDCIVYARRK